MQSAPISGDLWGVDFVSDTVGWAVGYLGRVIKTTDGATWTLQTSGVGKALYDVEAVSSQVAWFVGDTGTVSKTIDGGTTWVAEVSGVNDALLAVEFVNTQVGFIVGEDRTFLRTVNGGATWSPVTIGAITPGTSITDVAFYDASHGLIVEANGQTLETFDGGFTWEVRTDIPLGIYTSVGTLGSDAMVAGGNGRMSRLDATAPSRPDALLWATSSADATPRLHGAWDSMQSVLLIATKFHLMVERASSTWGRLLATRPLRLPMAITRWGARWTRRKILARLR